MVLREYKDLDTDGRQRLFVEVQCEICKSLFSRQKRQLNYHTCSAKCLAIFKGQRLVVDCAYCGSKIQKQKSKVESSNKNYCDRKCKEASEVTSNYRLKAFNAKGEICERCGYSNKKALDVHHKDRNRANNNIENLEVLCCNCHALEHR